MTSDIRLRMSVTAARMVKGLSSPSKRPQVPRVFFLTPDDYAEFVRTDPDYGWVPFYSGGRPAEQFCPLFEKIAVRQSLAKKPISQLFSCAGTAVTVADA